MGKYVFGGFIDAESKPLLELEGIEAYNTGLKLWDIRRFGEAKEVFERAAVRGVDRAHFYLCLYYLSIKDEEKAKTHFEKVRADIEDPKDAASFYMRVYVLQSKGMSKLVGWTVSKKDAAKCFEKSVSKGYVWGQYDLGVYYENGTGVGKNWKEAVKLYRFAANQGLADAQRNLGVCYEKGEGVGKDINEAFRLFKLAAEQGNV